MKKIIWLFTEKIYYVLSRLIVSVIFKLNKINRKYCSKILVFKILDNANALYNKNSVTFTGTPKLYIEKNTYLFIGNDFICKSYPDGIGNNAGSKIFLRCGGKLHIGNCVGFSNIVLHCYKEINIGNYVNIGDGCMIFDSNFHSTDWHDRTDRQKDIANARTASVTIKDYVFIGARSIICKGVTIGEKSMVAAGSVVVCDIPSLELWGGNPAKFIKKLENDI